MIKHCEVCYCIAEALCARCLRWANRILYGAATEEDANYVPEWAKPLD